ncbi:MAG TPA: YdcH family protein [Vicinamibacterales bacterium]
MAVDTHELRERLLATDHEFRDLASRHQELDQRLHELATRHFLSEHEQLEEIRIKKQKLRLKDRMEDILRRHQPA